MDFSAAEYLSFEANRRETFQTVTKHEQCKQGKNAARQYNDLAVIGCVGPRKAFVQNLTLKTALVTKPEQNCTR